MRDRYNIPMAAICPGCGRELDVTLFQFGRPVICDCGRVLREPEHRIEVPRPPRARTETSSTSGPVRARKVTGEPPAPAPPPHHRDPRDENNILMEELKRQADRLCQLILRSDYPEVEKLRKHFMTGELWTEFDEADIVKAKGGGSK